MKYLSLESSVNAFRRNVNTTPSRFWGLLGILVSIKERIVPGMTYMVNTSVTSQFLENLFCFKERKSYSSTKVQYFAMFAKTWTSRVAEIMCTSTPNFYDVAAWFFRNEAFSEEPSSSALVQKFSTETGLTIGELKEIFSFEERILSYSDSKYNEDLLLNELRKIYRTDKNYNSITADGNFIKANPGELSRAPFIQTIYASQQCLECIIITQFSIPDYYKAIGDSNTNTQGARYVVNDGLKDNYTELELGNILKSMVTDLGKDGANLFGLRYGGKLRNCSITNLIDIAGVQDVSDQDILKMKRIHELLLGNDYGIYFYNNQHDIKSKSQQYVDMSTHDLSIIRAMRTKPFILLAGISGTGKSRIVKEFAYDSCPDIPNLRKDPTSPGNYCLIEVKPNWHDSTELLGYESKIGGAHYNITTFIKFLVKAMRYTNVPFFVCLDEMNLAPVEQYFAEFLSILESRKLVNGIITSEPLIPASIFNSYNLRSKLFDYTQIDSSNYCHSEISEDNAGYGIENEIYKRLQEDGLRIPSNLIVIGTVNMDETTHQFSRKVIDRAMTIEMNIGDGVEPFKKFFDEYKDLGYIDTCLSKDVFLPSIVSANEALNLLNEEDAEFIKSHIPNLLSGLNEALSGTPFKVAYRVQNELVIYFTVLRQDFPDETAENLLSMAVDDILMMKVLPRIEGDDQLLEQPLIRLSNFTSNYPKSMSKIDEMMKRLSASQFTSFWP